MEAWGSGDLGLGITRINIQMSDDFLSQCYGDVLCDLYDAKESERMTRTKNSRREGGGGTQLIEDMTQTRCE